MKSFAIVLVFLLLVGATVFYFGWIQIQIPPDGYGVIFTRTDGWEDDVIRPGEFVWRWQRLIPTNLTLYVFEPGRHRTTVRLTGSLPSSQAIDTILQGAGRFDYELRLVVQSRIDPSQLPSLAKDRGLRPDDIDGFYEEIDARIGQAAIEALMTLIESGDERLSPGDSFRVTADTVAERLRSELNGNVDLSFDSSSSGPRPGEQEPFSTGEVDVAFLCSTSYVWLTNGPQAVVELVGAAWVPTDPRSAGRPIYFGDVIAPKTGPRHLRALVGKQVAYNDDVSLSGFHSLRIALAAAGVDDEEVGFVHSGSHLASLELLIAGEVDAAAIDSNVWRRCSREASRLADGFSRIAALGPYPVQPVVARSDLSPRRREEVRAALLSARADPLVAAAMESAELSHFAASSDVDFLRLRTHLADLDSDASLTERRR